MIPKDTTALRTTLQKMFEEDPRVFTPSYHMLGLALDLSDNGDLETTTKTILEVAGQHYNSDHVHINLY